jgi:hypothetical protein
MAFCQGDDRIVVVEVTQTTPRFGARDDALDD